MKVRIVLSPRPRCVPFGSNYAEGFAKCHRDASDPNTEGAEMATVLAPEHTSPPPRPHGGHPLSGQQQHSQQHRGNGTAEVRHPRDAEDLRAARSRPRRGLGECAALPLHGGFPVHTPGPLESGCAGGLLFTLGVKKPQVLSCQMASLRCAQNRADGSEALHSTRSAPSDLRLRPFLSAMFTLLLHSLYPGSQGNIPPLLD